MLHEQVERAERCRDQRCAANVTKTVREWNVWLIVREKWVRYLFRWGHVQMVFADLSSLSLHHEFDIIVEACLMSGLHENAQTFICARNITMFYTEENSPAALTVIVDAHINRES